jgi:hypothetical protein
MVHHQVEPALYTESSQLWEAGLTEFAVIVAVAWLESNAIMTYQTLLDMSY